MHLINNTVRYRIQHKIIVNIIRYIINYLIIAKIKPVAQQLYIPQNTKSKFLFARNPALVVANVLMLKSSGIFQVE